MPIHSQNERNSLRLPNFGKIFKVKVEKTRAQILYSPLQLHYVVIWRVFSQKWNCKSKQRYSCTSATQAWGHQPPKISATVWESQKSLLKEEIEFLIFSCFLNPRPYRHVKLFKVSTLFLSPNKALRKIFSDTQNENKDKNAIISTERRQRNDWNLLLKYDNDGEMRERDVEWASFSHVAEFLSRVLR